MRALTGGAPKELVPVAGVPVLEHVARECAASGIGELLVVVAPGKDAIESHLAPLAGAPGMPERIVFVTQEQPRGLADAIRHGRDFADGAPLVVALPDNLFVGDATGVAQVVETHRATGMNVVAMVEIRAEDAERFGSTAVYPGRLDRDLYRIERIPDKGAHGSTFDTAGAVSAFTGVGRYVFTAELFPTIDEVERSLRPGAELDDVPVMQRLLARGRLIGRRIRGRFLDVGLPQGYADANASFASGGAAR
jgi:UTP-glucose-1-phosphate uridylyltransferase